MKVTVRGSGTVAGRRRAASARRPGVLVVMGAATAVVCAGLVAGAGAAWGAPAGNGPGAAAARVHWGKAEPVPGLAALNKGYAASVSAVSCWGAGGCVIGGFYTDGLDHSQAFVARERKGRWGKAAEVPGTAALNQGGNAQVGQVSCARTGVCVAVGTYTDQDGNTQWFTVTNRNGRWRTASQVPDPALNQASISTVWCAPGGLCAAGGSYTDPSTGPEAWVMTQVHGHWQPALEVPGIAALNVGGKFPGSRVGVAAVSCASAGNCAAGGTYTSAAYDNDNSLPPYQPFVVTEANGTWRTALEVPGIEAFNPDVWAWGDTTRIACPSAGNCTGAGFYLTGGPDSCGSDCGAVFAVNERHGTWGQLKAAWPGPLYDFGPSSLTCPAAGDCVLAASYTNPGNETIVTGYLASETNDHWGRAGLIAGTQWSFVSCASAGYCAGGGTSVAGSAFVISERHGAWGKAVTPAGLPAGGGATVSAVACPPRITLCVAGGNQTPANSNRAQAFIVSQAR
jgi:hypothetical protein